MEPVWLTGADVLALHDEALTEFGGRSGVRSTGLLESALAKPRNLFAYGRAPTLFDAAAAYCAGIARNHPFVDGNKRTAFLAAAVFLELNGFLLAPFEAEVVETVIRVAEGKLDEHKLALWFKRNARTKLGRS